MSLDAGTVERLQLLPSVMELLDVFFYADLEDRTPVIGVRSVRWLWPI
jgi:hypothetical protein